MSRLRNACLAFCITISSASAHAVLLECSPQTGAAVQGPAFPLRLRFNSRVDAKRSRLAFVGPGGKERSLVLDPQSAPDTLTSQVSGAEPGRCRVRWQVLSSDGHITRGELAFVVGGK